MNETTIVGDALRAHWAGTDEQVTTLGFTAPALRRRARRQALAVRGAAAAAAVAVVAAGAGGAALLRDGSRDAAPSPATPPNVTTATLADGRTLTLTEGSGEPAVDGSVTADTMSSVCVKAPGEDATCTLSSFLGGSETFTLGDTSAVLAGIAGVAAARVEVAVGDNHALPAASAISRSGRATVFGLPWENLGVADPSRDGRTVTVTAYDGAGTLVARFGLVGSDDLIKAHPPQADVVELPTVEGGGSAWRSRDGFACVKLTQLGRRGVTLWCGETIPGGTSVMHTSQVDDASGLVLRVPEGTRAVRVGSLTATVKGEWASVISDRPLDLASVVRVTGADGEARDVGTVETLRVEGTYSGQPFTDDVPGG